MISSQAFDGVAGRITALIEQLGVHAGQKIPPERALATQLGVSRNSVREGLTVLRVFGLVEIRHGDGIYLIRDVHDIVPPIGAEITAVYPQLPALGEVTTDLHSLAARLSAQRRTAQDLGALAAAIAQMTTEVDQGGDGLVGDRAFHLAVVEAAHNPVLNDILHSFEQRAAQISHASLQRAGQSERSLATHCDIFEAIAVRDDAGAGRLMLDHLSITGEIELGTETIGR